MTAEAGKRPRHLLSAGHLTRDEVERLVEVARDANRSQARGATTVTTCLTGSPAGSSGAPTAGFVAGLLFFEPSTRTRVGFEVATARLGGTAVAVTGAKQTGAMSAAESWSDTVRSVGGYFDVVCVRHPLSDAVALAARLADVPVVNCGNGTDEHPTQALIDLLATYDHLGGPPDGRRIALVGDLRNMRSAHSFLLVLALYRDVTVVAVCPEPLDVPRRFREAFLASAGNRYTTTRRLGDVTDVDLVYVAGFAPSTAGGLWDEGARRPFRVNSALVHALGPDVGVLCPLPRIDEIDADVDDLPQAAYFRQSRLAVGMRMAVLRRCLSG